MTRKPATNLRPMTPSRKSPAAGDVFVAQLPDRRYLTGRVIRTDAEIGPMSDVILIYVYRGISASHEPPARDKPPQLLVPPIFTNRLPWSKGYFETVARWPLAERELLPQHCFYDVATKRHVDEFGNRLVHPAEPCGPYGLNSLLTIDDAISDALGMARADDVGSAKH